MRPYARHDGPPLTSRRTQTERRESTTQAILYAATDLFGERGYAETHLSEIGERAGVTVRPIYYYFGSKEALFEAVVAREEARLAGVIEDDTPDACAAPSQLHERLMASLILLSEPPFQRIVLVDSPAVLGRERWSDSEVVRTVESLMDRALPLADPVRRDLAKRMAVGAMTAAVLSLTEEPPGPERARRRDALFELVGQALRLLGVSA